MQLKRQAEEQTRQQQQVERERIRKEEEAKRQKALDDFRAGIEERYSEIQDDLENERFDLVIEKVAAFENYGQMDYRDVRELLKRARITPLEREVKAYPASEFRANMEGYRKLSKLDPDNPKYREKAKFYEQKLNARLAELDEQERIAKEKRKKEHDARVAKWGTPPQFNPWGDGSYRAVKEYMEENCADPDVKYLAWSDVVSADTGWGVKCRFRARNAFGGYVIEEHWFIIRFDQVVEVR